MGMISLEIVLNTLGLKLVLIEDEAATARTLAQRVPVDRANQRYWKCLADLDNAIGAPFAAGSAAIAHGRFRKTIGQGQQVRLVE